MNNELQEVGPGPSVESSDSKQEREQLEAQAEYHERRQERRKYMDLYERARRDGQSDLADRLEAHYYQLIDEELTLQAERDARTAKDAVQELSRRESGEAELFWDREGEVAELALPQIRKSLLDHNELSNLTLQYSKDGTRTYSAPMRGGMRYTEVHYSAESNWPNIVVAHAHKMNRPDITQE
jgi:hypothetical protein